jgi:D-sedoheptulose 7-phosphate isomerase
VQSLCPLWLKKPTFELSEDRTDMSNEETYQIVASRISQSIAVKQRILEDEALMQRIGEAAVLLYRTLASEHRVLFCGNGGSAADAQHLAAELSGRFYLDRPSLPAEACHVNSSFLTAYSNDYSFSRAYARYVEGFGSTGDLLIALSTSGNSENIIEAIASARKKEMKIIGLTGNTGGKMKELCDILLDIPSRDTPRIQEAHITIGHILCEIAENKLFR